MPGIAQLPSTQMSVPQQSKLPAQLSPMRRH